MGQTHLKGNSVTESTASAATKATKNAVTAAAATPFVEEAVNVVLDNPAQVASTVKWGVIGVSIAAGAAAGAGVVLGVQKLRARKADKKVKEEIQEITSEKTA